MGLLDFFKSPPNINTLKAKKNIQGLIKALFFQKDYNIRMEAAKALGDLKDNTAVEPLISALKDWSRDVRYYAAESLGKIGDPRAVDGLIEALKDIESWIDRTAAPNSGNLNVWLILLQRHWVISEI